jgi:hypothetical protein
MIQRTTQSQWTFAPNTSQTEAMNLIPKFTPLDMESGMGLQDLEVYNPKHLLVYVQEDILQKPHLDFCKVYNITSN